MAVAQTRAIGPGGGGAQLCAAIHPQDPNTMLLGQDVGGILKTTDGGANWRHVNTGLALPKATVASLGVVEIVYAPSDSSLLFASTWGGTFRSVDGAETWTRVLPPGDGPAPDWPGSSCVAADPGGLFVLAGTGDPFDFTQGDGLYRSTDGGLTFAKLAASGIPATVTFGRLLVDPDSPTDARHVYAATSGGLFRSVDSGLTFTKVGGSFAHDLVRDVTVASGATTNRFWLALQTLPGGSGGVYRSTDGLTWISATGDLPLVEEGFHQEVKSMVVSPTDSDRAYISMRFDYEVSKVYRTLDGGVQWEALTNWDIHLAWNTWFGFYQYGLAISQSDPSRLLMCVASEPVLSVDGGTTWRQVGARDNGDGTWTGTGVEVSYVYELEQSPTSERVYAAYEDIGLWRSDDRGNSWRLLFSTVTDGVAEYSDACAELHVNPTDGDELYAVSSSWSNSLREESGSWLLHSTNGGDSWTTLTISSPVAPGRACAAVDYSNPAASRTLLFAQHGDTLRRSTDGGQTWAVSTTGIDAQDVGLLFILAFDPITPNRVFAGTHTGSGDFAPGGGLYRSDDGGQSWERLNAFQYADVYSVRFAGSPLRMFVGAGTYDDDADHVAGELLVSDDGGQTFASALVQPFVDSLTVDPAKPTTLYAGSSGTYMIGKDQNAGVYRSADNGDTWERLDLPLSHTGLLTLLAPTWDPNTLYAGTRGDGIVPLSLAIAATSHTLAITTAGDGSGAVAKNPDQATYTSGSQVTLTATADASSKFVGWSGDVAPGSAQANPLTLTMDSDKAIVATFDQAQPSLRRDFEFQLPLFSHDSAWNQKTANAAVLPESEAAILVMFRALLGDPANLHPDGYYFSWAPFPYISIDSNDWTIPIYRMGTSEQTVLLKDYEGGPGSTNPNLGSHWDDSITIPAPASLIRPAGPQEVFSDGHLVLYNPDTGMSYDYWQATTALDAQDNSLGGGQEGTVVLRAGAIDVFDTNGTGSNPRGSDYWSARATGPSLLAGLLIPEDIASGSINHALAFSNIAPRNLNTVDPFEPFDSDSFWPVSTTETDYYSTDPNALASGQRIRLKQSIVGSDGLPLDEVNDLNLITRMYLQALRTYGAYLVDGAEGFAFYAEDTHSAVLNVSDDRVNELIGQPAGTPLDPTKTKWEIVIEALYTGLYDVPLAFGPDMTKNDPHNATITHYNFEVLAPLTSFTLAVIASGDGSGAVVKDPDQAIYTSGSQVTLTATADASSVFAGWSGNVPSGSEMTNPLTLTMNADKALVATFNKTVATPTFTLTVITAGDGVGSVAAAPDLPTYTSGSQVTLTATADVLSAFVGWSGDVVSGDEQTNPLAVVMDSHKTIVAKFEIPPIEPSSHTLTATANEHGSVAIQPQLEAYPNGSTVTLTATPDAGYAFAGWSGDVPPDEGRTNPLTIIMNADKTIVASFKIPPTAGDYKIVYKECELDVDIVSDGVVDLTITDAEEWSSLKIQKLKKLPRSIEERPGLKFLFGLRTIAELSIDGDFGKITCDAEIEMFEADGAVRSITTKIANIERIGADSVGAIKMTALRDDKNETAATTIITAGEDDMRLTLKGILLENLTTDQTLKYIKTSSKAWKDKITKQKFVSLGGIGRATATASHIAAARAKKITAVGASITPDTILLGQMLTTLSAKSKRINGVDYVGYCGRADAAPLMRVLAPEFKNIFGTAGVAGVFVAGYDNAGNPTYTGGVKTIKAKRGVGVLTGEAHVSPDANPIKFKPDQGEFVVFTE